MHDFSPGEMRPGALHFAGAASGGSTELRRGRPERAPLPLLRTAAWVPPMRESRPKRPLFRNGTSIVVNC